MKHGFQLLITHVAGERMKSQGTDGLSRGHLREGVCLGEFMRKYYPWDLFVQQRSPTFRTCIKSWLLSEVKFLEPSDWFSRAHDHNGGDYDTYGFWRHRITPGTYIWDLPPIAADVAIEELRKARVKRQKSTHLVFVPKLFTHLWKKQLIKACDIVLEIPPNQAHWCHDQFEPLTLGVCFPFLAFDPWQLRHTPKLCSIERKVRQMLKENTVAGGNILRQLFMEVTSWYTMPKGMVRKMLYFKRGREVSGHESGKHSEPPSKKPRTD